MLQYGDFLQIAYPVTPKVAAEKQLNAILNKITNQGRAFDRRCEQLCNMAIPTYEIVNMMANTSYEKAVCQSDYYGSSYADLCVRIYKSSRVAFAYKNFVKIIDSDESSHDGFVYRWSNCVSTSTGPKEVVRPFLVSRNALTPRSLANR